jgi:DeoR family transcriptional regulator, galactitol utilization operon repressor
MKVNEALADRQQIIIKLLSENDLLSVNELSEQLGVSTVTIRNDLNDLETQGYIVRTHGGAAPAFHRSILERRRENIEAKTRIARAAADLVRDGDTLMIEAGTTTALIAKYLAGKRDIHLVSNSTLAFANARSNPGVQITLTGGEFRRSTESFVGPIALSALEKLNVRLAFVGTDGFSVRNGMTTHLVEGAQIVSAMVERAATSVLVADSSKYGKSGFASVLPLSAVDLIISDSALGQEARAELEAASIETRCV